MGVSIGPRLFSHGNTDIPSWIINSSSVSIGPRLFSHGNITPDEKVVELDLVFQLGHDFSVMEIHRANRAVRESCGVSIGPRLFSHGNATK